MSAFDHLESKSITSSTPEDDQRFNPLFGYLTFPGFLMAVAWITALVSFARWVLPLLNHYVAWAVLIFLAWGFFINMSAIARSNGLGKAATLLCAYTIMGGCAYGVSRLLGFLIF